MTDPAIIEAAARALREVGMYGREAESYARTVLRVVTPQIRAQVLEEAAKVAEEEAKETGSYGATLMAEHIAAAIRALKERP